MGDDGARMNVQMTTVIFSKTHVNMKGSGMRPKAAVTTVA